MSHDSTPHERTEALEHHLEEHGHVHHDDVDAAIVAREMAFESGDGPSPALGAKIVARAWTDPEFKARLVDDGTATLSEYTPMTVPVAVMENTPDVHHMIVCTLCSCYPGAVLGDPPAWYKSFEYRSRVVREPRPCSRSSGWSSATMSRCASFTRRRSSGSWCCRCGRRAPRAGRPTSWRRSSPATR